MPTYQYECKKCAYELEEFQKVTDDPLLQCPNCKAKALFRVVTGGLGFSIQGKTMGAIADKNAHKFSSDYKHHLKQKTKKKDVLKEKGFDTASSKEEEVSFTASEVQKAKKLMKATKEEQQRYIEKGTI